MKRPTGKLRQRILALTKPRQVEWFLPRDPMVRLAANTVFANDDYYLVNPDLRDSGLTPAVDYFRIGAAEGRSPHPLFDAHYYLDRYPDVRASGQNPLLHYLQFGAREGRDPHWLFQTSYYVARYPDVRDWGNPLLHFLAIGQSEYRQTSPDFDPEFYRTTQVKACLGGGGVLTRFAIAGLFAGHAPSVDFDPAYYQMVHPDVAQTGQPPLEHYIRYGKAERRSIRTPRIASGVASHYLPVAKTQPVSVRPVAVDVIVPVYRGFDETRACLESSFAAINQIQVATIVVNDAAPELRLAEYLRGLSDQGRIQLIEHTNNAGFVASVNEGMSLHPDRDVVLLNSDTLVSGDWVDRLQQHAYSGRVASVTPFSNNATICSYPQFCHENQLAPGVTAADLDRSILAANHGRHCSIPTGVGFCMYIRREALNQAGLFDQATFGRGYGEENDFCERALDLGWDHLLAADTFVYHAGSVSFGANEEAWRHGVEAVIQKHPRYADHVNWHLRMNPANAFRISATLYRMVELGLEVRLSVSHNMGGGTLEYMRKLEAQTAKALIWLHLEPEQTGLLRLYCDRAGFEFSLTVDAVHEGFLLTDILRYVRLDRIHVNHVKGFPIDVAEWVQAWHLPYDVTLHDYYFVCPRVNLKDEQGRYCGEGSCPCEDGWPMAAWRASNGTFLAAADRVIAPSADTASRFQHYYPGLEMIAAWHDCKTAPLNPRPLPSDKPLKIAVLGIMSLHKGFAHLRDCVRIAATLAAPVEFIHIGGFGNEIKDCPHEIISTGWYQPDELPQLLKHHSPDLVWFPCQWPETFSYTLSACLEAGLPAAAPDLGAFAERMAGRQWSWIVPWDTTPAQWIEFFMRIRQDNFIANRSPRRPNTSRPIQSDYYSASYLTGRRD